MKNNIINAAGSFLIILLFVYTGAAKLIAHKLFLSQLMKVSFVKRIAPFLAVALPILEITTGLTLAVKRTQVYGWWLASLLMTLFTVYVSASLLSKSPLPCTCGGAIASMSWRQHLYFNIFFMLLSWTGLYNYFKKNKILALIKGSKLKTL